MEGQQLPTYLILSYLETKLFLNIPRKIISPVSYWVIAMIQEQGDLQISESLDTVHRCAFCQFGFTTMAVMNPPEKKLEKRTSVQSRWNKPRKSMDSGSTVVLRHIRVRTTTKTLLLTQFPHDLHSLVVSCRCLKISGSFLSVGFQSTAAYLPTYIVLTTTFAPTRCCSLT